MQIDPETAKAYTEVCVFLQRLGSAYTDKIPKDLLDCFEAYRDKTYEYKVDPNAPASEQFNDLSKKALALIAHLNLEYWATPEERERLTKIYEENAKKKKLRQNESLAEESEDS